MWLPPSLVTLQSQILPLIPLPPYAPLLQGGPQACPWSSGRPFLPLLEGARSGLLGLVMGPSRGGQFIPPFLQPLLLLHPACLLEGQPRGRPHPVGSLYHPGSGKRPGGSLFGAPPQDQLMHAQLLLRGTSFYKMDTPICLSSSDPRMAGVPLSKKWLCAHCDMQYSSQLDCQGHTLSAHSQVRSPSLCDCRVSTFNSAKALWDHLTLQHNIDVRKLKNEDPPSPWLKSNTRTSQVKVPSFPLSQHLSVTFLQ